MFKRSHLSWIRLSENYRTCFLKSSGSAQHYGLSMVNVWTTPICHLLWCKSLVHNGGMSLSLCPSLRNKNRWTSQQIIPKINLKKNKPRTSRYLPFSALITAWRNYFSQVRKEIDCLTVNKNCWKHFFFHWRMVTMITLRCIDR